MRRFVVVGKPIPKGNKKPIRRKNGKLGVREANPEAAVFGQLVKIISAKSAREQGRKVLAGPTAVQVHFEMPKPKSKLPDIREGWPAAKPDSDKLVRTVRDGLSNVQYEDDNGICWLLVTKRYVLDGQPPATTIQVDPLRPFHEATVPCFDCPRLKEMVKDEL